MPLEIRPLTYDDYDEHLTSWWGSWGWDSPTRDFLPENGLGGMMVYDTEGNIPICAGFVYLTNSKVAWVDWIVSNKNYRKKPHRKEAIDMLLDALTEICDMNDCKFVYALIKHKGLIESYEKIGYIKGDSYTGEMIKAL